MATDDQVHSCTLHTSTRFEHTGVHLVERLKTIGSSKGGHVNRLDEEKYQLLVSPLAKLAMNSVGLLC
jgi:hypothetical protein